MQTQGILCLVGSLLLLVSPGDSQYLGSPVDSGVPAERTRAIALLFSCLQCFPSREVVHDGPTQRLLHVHDTFRPEEHLDYYRNRTDIVTLVNFVYQWRTNGTPIDVPFTNAPSDIDQMSIILKVLYHNADNWALFYDTATWLLHRVCNAQLWWAVMITCLEKFTDTVTVPSHTETFPQLFAPKNYVLQAAGLSTRRDVGSPLQYWISDPRIHEFHSQWHMDNPFWWDPTAFGVNRHRRGELFMYMHHQISVRYRAEWWSNWLPGDVEPLGLEDNCPIPEGYVPDVVNVNYADFFSREPGKRIGDFGTASLADLRTYFSRLEAGIEQGYFFGGGASRVPLRGVENGTDTLGATVESALNSANVDYYGSFHNFLHRELAGANVPQLYPIPGTQSHPETSMRDPVFYRLHARVDQLFLGFKSKLQPYSERDLSFRGVNLVSVRIQTSNYRREIELPFYDVDYIKGNVLTIPVLRTYFSTETYDISTAARPCRAVNDAPLTVPVKTLNHIPFSYQILVRSIRSYVAYGMVRIFMWPEFAPNGTLIEGDAIRTVAIELDRFRVRLDPGKDTVISRSSLDSSITKRDRAPGVKELSRVDHHSNFVSNPNIRRACGFPNNLLLPRGTKEGMPFKMAIFLSDETDVAGIVDPALDPHFPLCGALNGRLYPDKRPMGFPFDRPGTRFNLLGDAFLTNFKELRVLIKHQE